LNGSVLEVDDLGVRFGAHTVLDGIDLNVEAGEFLGIVGPNGGGKTTFLRTVLGLLPPSRGQVRLFGGPPSSRHARRRLAYVPQNAVHVDPRFPATTYETVMLGRVGQRGLIRRLNAEDRAHAQEAMEEVGIAHLADHQVGTLSGGQRQRAFLAQALASEPDLLILDEPTTGVDPAARESFYRLLDHLNHDHDMTVLLVSHDTHALVLTAHRLVAINHRVVYDGPPEGFHEVGGAEGAYAMHVPHEEVGHPPRRDESRQEPEASL
jgi:zinc transport system ATP-binding protein